MKKAFAAIVAAIAVSCTVILVVLLVAGCSKTPENLVYQKDECVRVFMHEPGRYSVLNKELKAVSFRNMRDGNASQLVTDVPKDKAMWYEGEYRKSVQGYNEGWKWVKIHIHDLNDINGGAWDTGGKHSQNIQTRPIE